MIIKHINKQNKGKIDLKKLINTLKFSPAKFDDILSLSNNIFKKFSGFEPTENHIPINNKGTRMLIVLLLIIYKI
tara:strand:- start:4344 stop:4568 length:225 start_codon:yes stop_codon:yes gene_type:complete